MEPKQEPDQQKTDKSAAETKARLYERREHQEDFALKVHREGTGYERLNAHGRRTLGRLFPNAYPAYGKGIHRLSPYEDPDVPKGWRFTVRKVASDYFDGYPEIPHPPRSVSNPQSSGLLAPIADPGTTAHVLKSRSRSLDRNLVPWTRRRSRSSARCSGGGAENVATRAFNAALALAERRHQENMAECKRTHNAEIMRAEQRHWANLQHAEQRRQYETQQLLYQNHHQKALLTACFQQIMMRPNPPFNPFFHDPTYNGGPPARSTQFQTHSTLGRQINEIHRPQPHVPALTRNDTQPRYSLGVGHMTDPQTTRVRAQPARDSDTPAIRLPQTQDAATSNTHTQVNGNAHGTNVRPFTISAQSPEALRRRLLDGQRRKQLLSQPMDVSFLISSSESSADEHETQEDEEPLALGTKLPFALGGPAREHEAKPKALVMHEHVKKNLGLKDRVPQPPATQVQIDGEIEETGSIDDAPTDPQHSDTHANSAGAEKGGRGKTKRRRKFNNTKLKLRNEAMNVPESK